LDAWAEAEAVDGLVNYGHREVTAKDAYWLCGGNIRDMIAACTPEGYNDKKVSIDSAVSVFV
jgi:hypothetical protein